MARLVVAPPIRSGAHLTPFMKLREKKPVLRRVEIVKAQGKSMLGHRQRVDVHDSGKNIVRSSSSPATIRRSTWESMVHVKKSERATAEKKQDMIASAV